MNSFKEWLSDYLRYFILLLAVLLALGAIFLGVKLYQSTQTVQDDGDSIHILEGTENETGESETGETEESNWKETETEKSVTGETETAASGKETGETGVGETAGENAAQTTKQNQEKEETQTETVKANGSAGAGVTSRNTSGQSEKTDVKIIENNSPQTEAPVTETPVTEAPETDPPETDPPQPVYLTMTGACYIRSYADYGDNIIGEYPAGTVVEFLEDVGGWYKVQVDGMVGYMGARFFS